MNVKTKISLLNIVSLSSVYDIVRMQCCGVTFRTLDLQPGACSFNSWQSKFM